MTIAGTLLTKLNEIEGITPEIEQAIAGKVELYVQQCVHVPGSAQLSDFEVKFMKAGVCRELELAHSEGKQLSVREAYLLWLKRNKFDWHDWLNPEIQTMADAAKSRQLPIVRGRGH